MVIDIQFSVGDVVWAIDNDNRVMHCRVHNIIVNVNNLKGKEIEYGLIPTHYPATKVQFERLEGCIYKDVASLRAYCLEDAKRRIDYQFQGIEEHPREVNFYQHV